jgi:hypothetical protein
MYNPFLVSEPTYTAPQQTIYPQMTGEIQAQLSDANRLYGKNNPGIDITQQPDPLYSMANIGMPIRPREYNQPTLLRNRIQPLQNFSVENVRDITNPGGTMPIQQPLETPYLDAIMNQGNVPVDYAPFSSEEEMHKFYNPSPTDATIENKNLKIPNEEIFNEDQLNAFVGLGMNDPFDASLYQPNKTQETKTEPAKTEPAKTELAVSVPTTTGIEKPFWSWQTQMGNYGKEKLPPKPNTTNTETTLETQTPKNKFGLAEGYYLGNAMLNATAAINNMVQPEPPSIQMKIPHFERQRLNPEPYDNMRSQVRDQGTQAYRLQRENISQASDLMKGLAAVTSGTQQGLMNVGLQQATADQQIQGINQQISMQEQGLQTDTLNKEAITNWQIQDEFYKTKGQAISSALAGLSQTGGQYAKYKTMQDMVEKQDAINKSAAEINNEMQASLLEYELSETALSSQEYQDYYKSQRKAEQDRINKELLGDEKYKALSDYNNGVLPSYSSYQYNIDSPESQEKLRTINVAKRFQSEYPLGAAPDIAKFPNDKDGYDKAVAEYNKYKTYNDRYLNDPRYKAYEAEQAFWNEALEKFNESSLKKSTAETYLKSRGLTTQTDLLQRLKAISERGSQIVR